MLGRVPESVEPFSPRVGGDDSYSLRLWHGGDAMLLKIKKRPGSPVGVYFHSRIKQAGVPVPELIAFDAGAGPYGQACAIWEWMDGEPAEWGDGRPCPYDEADFGELLARIHALEFDGDFGLLGDDPSSVRTFTSHPDLAPTSETWAGFFLCDRAATRYFAKGYLTRREADALSSLPHLLGDELNAAQRRLLHMGDIMHNGNMIVERGSGRILAVVDYVEATAGDPRWELAWMDYYFGQYPFYGATFDMARFRSAYGTDHDPDDTLGRFYLAAALVFEKLLFFDPKSERGRWAIATLKQILNSFGGDHR
jgi:hypothetical protein